VVGDAAVGETGGAQKKKEQGRPAKETTLLE
jgi:hypothetical protein